MMRSTFRRRAGRTAAILAAASGFLLVSAFPALAASGTVQTAGDPLNVRRAPTTSATAVGTVANGATVTIDCQTIGSSVSGPLGTSTIWDYVPALRGYISHSYVKSTPAGRIAPDCGVGSGSAECSTGACAGEAQFRSSDAHFIVYDRAGDGKSAVVAYWLEGGAGPLYVWNSNGNGTSVDKAVNVPKGSWVYYKVCIADYSATNPILQNCSGGLTDYAS
ncbi:SH3 domain-containing protein [Amycolatopsis nigrescens]|uniref:SH3 domain-containing protein n=1 Tax=Amycolatopsis nigrescens TaxID=381445 RepID=UPI0003A97F7E|nr:SH3 domain-containing protein [Amycolatopsis nigrescens]